MTGDGQLKCSGKPSLNAGGVDYSPTQRMWHNVQMFPAVELRIEGSLLKLPFCT